MSSSRSMIKDFYAIGSTTAVPVAAKVSGSMGATITGPTTTIDMVDQVCYQVSWTSSDAVGVISVQGSVTGVEADFKDITFSPVLAQPNSNNGGYLINLALVPFTYIRLKYTRTSGTGSLEVHMSVKGN